MTVAMMADMPEAVARHAGAPSSAASRSQNICTVGFEKREYTGPWSVPAKRAAACAAFWNTKLDVR